MTDDLYDIVNQAVGRALASSYDPAFRIWAIHWRAGQYDECYTPDRKAPGGLDVDGAVHAVDRYERARRLERLLENVSKRAPQRDWIATNATRAREEAREWAGKVGRGVDDD